MWQLTESSLQPKYQQIIQLIEQLILRGALLPGEKLPAERTLAKQLNVNRSTIVHALDELASRGTLIRRQGSGTTVNPGKWGITPINKTNWRYYLDQGGFLPISPYLRQHTSLIEKKFNTAETIDLATGELPAELLPNMALPQYSWQQLLAEEQHCDVIGYTPLRDIIRDSLQSHLKQTVSLSQILITSGVQQALFLITQCLLRPGDAVAIESPSFFYALPLFQSAGLRLFALPIDSAGIIPETLCSLHTNHRIKMVFLNPTYQNPTGIVMSEKRRQQLIQYCSQQRIPIVEDDSYRLTHFTNTPLPPSLKQLDTENVLYIASLSKTMGNMSRIGWLTGPAAVVKRLAEARQEMDFNLSIFPQVLACQLLQHDEYLQHLQKLRLTLQCQSQWLTQALKTQLKEKIHYKSPGGGFNLWCQITTSYPINKLVNQLRERNIMTIPASVFGDNKCALRMSFVRLKQESQAIKFATYLADILNHERDE